VGPAYRHDGNTGKGEKSARFTLAVPKPANYTVLLLYPALGNRASNTPVTLTINRNDL